MLQNKLMLPYRVLDLCDGKGIFCGRILGDFGCDVIKVEKPGYDPSLKLDPFYHDFPDSQKSLFWLAYNTNKRSITLNIDLNGIHIKVGPTPVDCHLVDI